jgi:hypothetical protein
MTDFVILGLDPGIHPKKGYARSLLLKVDGIRKSAGFPIELGMTMKLFKQ